MTARVSSQPRRSCHAGRVKRKKLSGRPKIGSMMLPAACGAYQKRARVGHSCIIAVPVSNATASEPKNPTMRSTGSMERLTGCPPRMIWRSLGRLAWLARLRAENAPYRMANVATAKSAKTPHCSRHDVQKTSLYPSERNQSRSTQ